MTRTEVLASLAALMNLEPRFAYILPSVVEVSAGKVGMSEEAFIAECAENPPLRAYLASVINHYVGPQIEPVPGLVEAWAARA